MALNTTNFAFALKSLWPQSRAKEMTYKNNPLLALIPKKEDAGGENIVVAVRYGDPQGRSATFATAQANKGNQSGVKFTLTRVSDYSLASIGNEVVEASRNNEQSLLRAMDTEIEGAHNTLTRSAAVSLYGDGSGAIGAVGSVSAGVITLATADDVTNFEKGMKIVANPTLTGTAGNMRSGTGTVSAVDRSAGTVTYTGTITSIAAADYLYVEGDYDSKVKGLKAWLPSSVTSTSFFGVDRTADATRLGGVKYDGSSGHTVLEALVKASMRTGREGGAPKHCFVNFEQFANLEIDLGARVQYTDLEAKDANVGFRGIKIVGPKGDITVIADMNCPKADAWMLQLDTWKLYSVGKVPHMLDMDGNKFLREASADAYEVRLAYYAQLGSEAPGYNCRITLPT